ncbi:MAG: hypothetical protein Q9222_003072 [Ikaeria aurantiellina]
MPSSRPRKHPQGQHPSRRVTFAESSSSHRNRPEEQGPSHRNRPQEQGPSQRSRPQEQGPSQRNRTPGQSSGDHHRPLAQGPQFYDQASSSTSSKVARPESSKSQDFPGSKNLRLTYEQKQELTMLRLHHPDGAQKIEYIQHFFNYRYRYWFSREMLLKTWQELNREYTNQTISSDHPIYVWGPRWIEGSYSKARDPNIINPQHEYLEARLETLFEEYDEAIKDIMSLGHAIQTIDEIEYMADEVPTVVSSVRTSLAGRLRGQQTPADRNLNKLLSPKDGDTMFKHQSSNKTAQEHIDERMANLDIAEGKREARQRSKRQAYETARERGVPRSNEY